MTPFGRGLKVGANHNLISRIRSFNVGLSNVKKKQER